MNGLHLLTDSIHVASRIRRIYLQYFADVELDLHVGEAGIEKQI